MKNLLIAMVSFFSVNVFGQVHELQVHNFTEIPTELLSHIGEMGTDTSLILNKYEGKYLNFIFKIDSQDLDLVGKKVGFLRNKIDYFKQTRDRFYDNTTTVGGSCLYIFDAAQKEESGGYDAAIVYWSKFLLPTEKIVQILKDRH